MIPWTEQNLLDLIARQQEEHLQLDFKRSPALARTDREKAEMSKDISAFANTIGGTILYGIHEAPDPPHAAVGIDPIDPTIFTKEWLEQVINSRIHPRIPDIFIDPIAVPSTRAGQVVFRVVIPESTTAHQAADKRYYKRFNFESVPMEDHEIRFVMSRLVKAAYKIFPQVRVEGYGGGIECFIRVVVLNSTEITGHDCSLYAYVPADIYPQALEHERVQVLQVPCVRLSGHAGVTLSPGPTELHITRNLILQGEHYNPAEPIPIFFRVYDSFGLALFQRFSFAPQTRVLQLLQDIEVGRTMGGIQP